MHGWSAVDIDYCDSSNSLKIGDCNTGMAPVEQIPAPEGEGAEVVATTDEPIDDSEGTPTEPAPLEPAAVEAEVTDDVVEDGGSEEEGG